MTKEYLYTVVIGHDHKVVLNADEAGVYGSIAEILEKVRGTLYGFPTWEPLLILIERTERRHKVGGSP